MSYLRALEGFHVCAHRGLHGHHGIYFRDHAGHDLVIHYTSRRGKTAANARIQVTTLAEFAAGERVSLIQYNEPVFPPDEALQRALSRLGERSFNIFGNNCECFARWCKTGKSESHQVGTVKALGVIAAVCSFIK